MQAHRSKLARFAPIFGFVALLFGATGCVAPAEYRRTVDQYDAELRALREERSNLKRQNGVLETQVASLSAELGSANDENVRLRSASAPRAESTTPSKAADFSDLTELGIGVEARDGGAVLTLPSSITFASGKAELSAEGQRAVDAVGKSIEREYPEASYSVEGHTDSDPISKSNFDSNRELSLERAMAVLARLVDGPSQIADAQCSVVGWGPHRPVAANDSTTNKAKNRRVEIVIHDR